MGRIDYDDAIRTAQRFAAARTAQNKLSSEKAGAEMLNKRRDFMLADRLFFESIIEGSDLMPLRYLALGQLAAQAVGRLHLPPGEDRAGNGFATGFLVAPGLLMTNKHVLPSEEWARAATLTMDAEDDLDGLPRPPRVFQLDPRRLFVAAHDLDFALVAVAPRAVDGTPLASYGYLRLHAATGKIVRDEYATIVQHPNGRQKHIAARNNQIRVYVYDEDLTEEERKQNSFIYYSTDTLKGSSGAPVMSDQWYVVALHRRGVPETKVVRGETVILRTNGKPAADDDPDEVISYESNEGVRISHIFARLAEISADPKHHQRDSAQQALSAIRAAAGDLTDGPVSKRTLSYTALQERPGTRTRIIVGETLEIVRRNISKFPEDRGYDPDFLPGFSIPLPKPSTSLRKELAPRLDDPTEVLLPFRHFTTAMHARRRLPIFAAVNIAGALKPAGGMGNRPPWSYDPRIDEAHQPDDSIFSTMVQRGHMAAREYVFWGLDEDERREADVHSFTLTNVCPQIQAFNGGGGEWFKVERLVVAGSKTEDLRVTELTGPILRAQDPDYDSLRGPTSDAEFGTHIRIPLRFWKIIAWVEDGELQHRAFVLDQREEIDDAGPLELDIEAPAGVKKSTIKKIEALTDLEFEGF
jgi:endonuclease G, mitochondrial